MATNLLTYLQGRPEFSQYMRLVEAAKAYIPEIDIVIARLMQVLTIPDNDGVMNFARQLGYTGTDADAGTDFIVAKAAEVAETREGEGTGEVLVALLLTGSSRVTQWGDPLEDGETLTSAYLNQALTIDGTTITDQAIGTFDAKIISQTNVPFDDSSLIGLVAVTDSFVLPYDWPIDPAPEPAAKVHVVGTSSSDKLNTGGTDDLVEAGDGSDEVRSGAGDDDVYGGGGNDTLRGGDGNDLLLGETGRDELRGDAGNDTLLGGNQDDKLDGGSEDDHLDGGSGKDRLYGRDGNDTLLGDNDDDKLWGGTGDDSLWGGDGNDQMLGEDGNDTMDGDEGDDQMLGGLGDDLMQGGFGLDELVGEDGADTLNGGYDNDILEGGTGADVFAFGQFAGSDWIMDFEDGIDLIDLSETSVTAFDQLTFAEAGPNVLISAAGEPGFGITLAYMTLAEVDAGDFLF
ncbi:calcium-binding protein [Mesobacterium pallidum]|uniref:calcium-binding protein n=1 Tax=Mesobacterium pallidum TaxID=2872037 RepID=UPI001EE384F6|nr:hypothetical protein [Mesobacterium pallidum]